MGFPVNLKGGGTVSIVQKLPGEQWEGDILVSEDGEEYVMSRKSNSVVIPRAECKHPHDRKSVLAESAVEDNKEPAGEPVVPAPGPLAGGEPQDF